MLFHCQEFSQGLDHGYQILKFGRDSQMSCGHCMDSRWRKLSPYSCCELLRDSLINNVNGSCDGRQKSRKHATTFVERTNSTDFHVKTSRCEVSVIQAHPGVAVRGTTRAFTFLCHLRRHCCDDGQWMPDMPNSHNGVASLRTAV